jgi:PIN domain nuclease of toxin-antitoxin system
MSAISGAPAPAPNLAIYILDTSAVLRLLDREAGFDRVYQILQLSSAERCKARISAVNWGELAAKLYKRHGSQIQKTALSNLLAQKIDVIPVTSERAERSGVLHAGLGISYADSFGVELAQSTPNSTLVTADYGVKPAETMVQIEFLPAK